MATSKILQTIPCVARSLNRQNILVFIRNQTVKSVSAVNYNLQIGFLQKRFYSNANKIGEERLVRVYDGQLTSQIRRVKMFSLSTSLIGLCAQRIIYTELSAQSMPLMLAAFSVIGFFTYVNPFLLHYITKKYVTQLDYNKVNDSYVATFVNFWCIDKKFEFKVEEVLVPDIPGMFTTFIAKGKPMFIEARLFDDPSHYAKIMGYDKPMDFKLNETSGNKSNKT